MSLIHVQIKMDEQKMHSDTSKIEYAKHILKLLHCLWLIEISVTMLQLNVPLKPVHLVSL